MLRLKKIFHSDHYLKIVFFLVLSCIINNVAFLAVSIFLLKKKDRLIFIVLFIALLLRSTLAYLPFDIYYVNEITSSGANASNLLREVRIFEEDLNYGDVIKVDDIQKEGSDFKSEEYELLFSSFDTRALLLDHLNKLDNAQLRLVLQRLLLGIYPDTKSLGYNFEIGLSQFVIISFILKKIRYKFRFDLDIIVACLPLFLLEGMSYQLFRIIVLLYLQRHFDKSEALAYSALLMMFLDPFKITSMSFIFPFLLRFILLFQKKKCFRFTLALLQSCLFDGYSLLNIFFFRPLVFFSYIMALIGLIFSFLNIDYLIRSYLLIFETINYLLFFEIRGQISFLALSILLLLMSLIKIKKDQVKLLFLTLFLLSGLNTPLYAVHFIDVGQGDAILLQSSLASENILIDTGSTYNYQRLKKALKKHGVYTIDHLIITHLDKDHSGNIENLAYDFKVEEIHLSHDDLITDKFAIYSLNKNDYDNENANSLVYYLELNELSFLFTGDITSEVEKELVAAYDLKIDVLKLAHHGSDTSTSAYFLKHSWPDLAIASTSGAYGHPSPDVLKRLESFGIKTLVTKDSGDISFYSLNKYLNFYQCQGRFAIIMK